MPTGVAIRDPREQLFGAAERVLLAGGPAALTSRAVTEEAGVAKGVLHRHFADFDAFLADYLIDRARRVGEQDVRLRACAGQGDLADNLAEALTAFFGSVAQYVLVLVTFRDGLRARLRAAGVPGLPVLTEGTRMVAGYLEAERDLGRLPAVLDTDLKTLMLVGSVQLAAAGRDDEAPSFSEVRRVVVEALGLG
ncbi:transcriptional regulator, TetR family [Catenulispora acidiphila DSM 44928]|uniref:Transcriptional regulator, TetR family n=1 Tax=Catenulispora acidiphila (strain DSM 44928 / JCM 14897 / NBRC 102108 / NRRL B-24433 / ID139908) TaxID=479433 RepID=C7PVQ9_CATAD|nr:TetR/AcrR family transcriptional regulator [Catenulispora acidiphila]ACU71301.1 transcriptional regulator, TetR family [Catenulispora acidiphila DSM 44928]